MKAAAKEMGDKRTEDKAQDHRSCQAVTATSASQSPVKPTLPIDFYPTTQSHTPSNLAMAICAAQHNLNTRPNRAQFGRATLREVLKFYKQAHGVQRNDDENRQLDKLIKACDKRLMLPAEKAHCTEKLQQL